MLLRSLPKLAHINYTAISKCATAELVDSLDEDDDAEHGTAALLDDDDSPAAAPAGKAQQAQRVASPPAGAEPEMR